MSTATATAELVKAAGVNPEYLVEPTDVTQHIQTDAALSDTMTTLVKGVGYAVTDKPTRFGEGGNAPLTDPDKVFGRAMRAEKAFRAAITKGWKDPLGVVNSWHPTFNQQFPGFGAMFKSFTTTTPLASGLAPFNLSAPSRLIYPVEIT